jgi:ABC-2 type transport system ATP-binding protein
MSESVISVHGLTKRYGSTVAIADVSLDVQRGEIFGIIGRNGAGKTTTVECLQGLRRADGGRLRVLGLDPATDAMRLRGRMGCQLQESALPHRIRVWEALRWFSSFAGGAGDCSRGIEEWGLVEKRIAHFSDLSGGQRQRLFVALALVSNPELVFLDEMTTGLDPIARRAAWDVIEAIRARGTTVVLVTHFMDEAERLCDRVAIMDAGRVVALEPPAALIGRAGRAVIRFSHPGTGLEWLEQIPSVLEVSQRRGEVEVAGTGPVLLDVAAGLAARGIRPDDLRVRQPTLEDVFLAITGTPPED